MGKIQIAIFRSVYQIDMKFDRQLRPATETLLVVSYDGKTIPRWRTAAILKIVILPYLSEKSSDFHEILYTAADFVWTGWTSRDQEWKSCTGQTPSSTERISCFNKYLYKIIIMPAIANILIVNSMWTIVASDPVLYFGQFGVVKVDKGCIYSRLENHSTCSYNNHDSAPPCIRMQSFSNSSDLIRIPPINGHYC